MQISRKFIILLIFVFAIKGKTIYNTNRSYVTPITTLNFQKQLVKIRETTNQVSIIHYYKFDDGFSQNFAKEFDEFTNEFRGVFRIGSCDCQEEAKICEKEGITTFPTFRIYPPVPMPSMDVEGEITIQRIQQQAARHLSSNIIEISSSNINTFINESPSVPKVLLFTEKKGTPMIFKGLSVTFENKLFFGIVRSSDDILVERYRIKKFPSIIVVKATEKNPQVYKGEMKFNPIHDFLNVFSEVFVPGGGSSSDTSATKQWLTEIVPEMHQKSAGDICLKQEGVLCVILIVKEKPQKQQTDIMKNLNSAYDRKIARGNQYKFMWLDATQEPNFAKIFNFEGNDKVVILNPGKRKRYVEHEEDLDFQALKNTLERINGGDAKFIRIGQEIPEFAFRKDI